MVVARLVFAPVTRWVLAWKDGSTLRCYDDYGRDTGPELFINRAWAQSAARGRIGIAHGSKPVKVRVTIEVAP